MPKTITFHIINLGYTITGWLVTQWIRNTTSGLAFEMEVYVTAWLPVFIHKLFRLNNWFYESIWIRQQTYFGEHCQFCKQKFFFLKFIHWVTLLHWIQVTNHMVSAGNGAVKPALGESWKSVPHVRLMISREHSSNICTGTVLKHTLLVFPLAIRLYFYLSLQQQ